MAKKPKPVQDKQRPTSRLVINTSDYKPRVPPPPVGGPMKAKKGKHVKYSRKVKHPKEGGEY